MCIITYIIFNCVFTEYRSGKFAHDISNSMGPIEFHGHDTHPVPPSYQLLSDT